LLANPLHGKEVLEAIKLCPKRKSPGIDGIQYEFYKEYWDLIGADMVAVFNDILQHGTLGGKQKQGVIIIVPKTSNPRNTTDFRPHHFTQHRLQNTHQNTTKPFETLSH
jgi:hypothetical protein